MENTEINIAKIKAWLGSGAINIFGRPFSGKDTQADILSKKLGAPIIGGGDIVRNSKLKDQVATGLLAPKEQYLALILPYLQKPEFHGKPLILNSLGRWHGEEKSIIKTCNTSGHPIKLIIYLDIDDQTVIKRYQTAKKLSDRGNRDDDSLNAIATRLDEFNNKTLPVISFYKDAGLLITLNGLKPKEAVAADILAALLLAADS